MGSTKPEDLPQLLRSTYVSDEYNPEILKQIAEATFNPDNCLVILQSKSLDPATLTEHEHWYDINYTVEKFDEELRAALLNPQIVDNGKKLDLPPPNNLLPKNFDVLPEDASNSEKPQLLKTWGDQARLWYKKDDKFKKPKAVVAAKIYTGDLNYGKSIEASVFARVWKQCSLELLREFKYMADCAALEMDISILRDNI